MTMTLRAALLSVVVVLGAALLGACSSSAKPIVDLGRATLPTVVPPPALPVNGPAIGTLHVVAGPGGRLAFSPTLIPARTGIYRIDVKVATAGHTFSFLDSSTRSRFLTLNTPGVTVTTRAFFAQGGDYDFVCTVPGHQAMVGVVRVNGPTESLDQAQTAAASGVAGGTGAATTTSVG